MIRKQAASAILAAVVLQASLAHGLGLGTITLRSALNEPLDAEIRLRGAGNLDPAQIRVNLGSAGDFEHAGVERLNFLSELKFAVRVDGDGDGVVHVTSNRPVREPYLDFLIEARWPNGRVLREYTLLLDLPIYTGASTTPVSPPAQQSRQVDAYAGGDDGGLAPGQGEYRVRSGDTLWRIATRSRATGVSVRQMINAIHRDNPQAFIGGNIDLLRAGAVLRLPQGSDVSGLSAPGPASPIAAATSTIEQAPPPVTTLDAPQPDAGSVVESADDARLEIAGDPLASPEAEHAAGGESPTAGTGGDGALRETQESLLVAERANEELQDRVKTLEAQVADFRKLAEIEKEDPAVPVAAEPRSSLIDRILGSTLTWVALALTLLAGMVAFLSRRRREVHEFVPVPYGEPRVPDPGSAKPAARATEVAPAVVAAAAPVIDTDADADASDPLAEADVYLAYGQQDRAEQVLSDALRGHADLPDVRLRLMGILADRGDESEFLRHYGALGGNATARHAANAILEQQGLLHWVGAAEPGFASELAGAPLLNRDQPLQIDLAAELQQVADTLGGTAKERATAEQSALLSRTEQAIARAAAELGTDAEALGSNDDFDAGSGEFDFSLDLDDLANDEGDATPDADAVEHAEFELPLGEFELEIRGAAVTATPPDKLDEDLELLAGSDETATKLELARAYLDMGDEDGARDILEEVASEGDVAQREEAAALLARIHGNS